MASGRLKGRRTADEPSFLASVSILVSRRGCRVETAQSGRAGIRRLRKEKPDLVISDIKMPEVTGLDVLKARSISTICPRGSSSASPRSSSATLHPRHPRWS